MGAHCAPILLRYKQCSVIAATYIDRIALTNVLAAAVAAMAVMIVALVIMTVIMMTMITTLLAFAMPLTMTWRIFSVIPTILHKVHALATGNVFAAVL
jgi:hypothetical protein